MGRLAAAVHLDHPVTRERIILQPGDEPEPEVAALITNPDAWEPDETDDEVPEEDQASDPE